jgi:endonuclease/exonuclease/phosphatase family metal-dependent hydrolase
MLSVRSIPFRVGQYNLLCPAYGVKWAEREACLDWVSKETHGGSNWEFRWPAIKRIIERAQCDILALEECEECMRSNLEELFASLGLSSEWYDHPGREDALVIAYNKDTFSLTESRCTNYPPKDPKVTTGCVDLCHSASGMQVRCLVAHHRGRNTHQLADLFLFANGDERAPGVTVVCGDFNEDFAEEGTLAVADGHGENVQLLKPWPEYISLGRSESAGELLVSRPKHKQAAEQTSGKGKVDYIFAKSCGDTASITLRRDEESSRALTDSHQPCAETGKWPSDHGMEAMSIVVTTADRSVVADHASTTHTAIQADEEHKEAVLVDVVGADGAVFNLG